MSKGIEDAARPQGESPPISSKAGSVTLADLPFTVDEELNSILPPLTAREYSGLRRLLRTYGVMDRPVIWKEARILLDGHARLTICLEEGIEFPSPREVSLETRDDAKLWIINNQGARKNLNVFEKIDLAKKSLPLRTKGGE